MWQVHGYPEPRASDLGPDPLYAYRRDEHECFECGAPEGTLHELGCEWEPCPFCGEQAVYCPHCVTEDGRRKKRFLDNRVPHIDTPTICPRCGLVDPEMFMVDAETWRKYVPPYLRNKAPVLRLLSGHSRVDAGRPRKGHRVNAPQLVGAAGCLGCRFYYFAPGLDEEGYPREESGQCRRKAPIGTISMNDAGWRWPEVYEHEWCGEREPRRAEDEGGTP